jgi:hypothetical protein
MPAYKYDWIRAERNYMDAGYGSGVTLKVISERHGIPYQTVRRYAAKNRWNVMRWLKRYPPSERKEIIIYLNKTNADPLRDIPLDF